MATFQLPGELDNSNDPWRVKGPGNIHDQTGYLANINGKPQYITYAELKAKGLGDPRQIPNEVFLGGSEGGVGQGQFMQFAPNDRMPPYYNPEEGELEGFLDTIKSSLSEPYLPMMLSFGAGAFSGVPGPGDWFKGAGAEAGATSAGAGVSEEMAALGGFPGATPIAPGAARATTLLPSSPGGEEFSFADDIADPATGFMRTDTASMSSLVGAGSTLAQLASRLGITPEILKGVISQASGQGALGTLASTLGISEGVLKLIGGVAGTAASMWGAKEESDARQRLADQFAGYGAEYRKRLSDTYANPEGWLKSPEGTAPIQQGTDMLSHSLSVKGNPAGSPNALQEMQNFTSNQLFGKLGQERDRLAGFGGLTAYNQAAPGAARDAASSEGNIWNAAGAGINNIFSPPQTLAQQYKDFLSFRP